MERAGRILTRMKATRESLSAGQLVAAAWPAAVGRTVAAHTRVASCQEGLLVIEVEDALWQRNLESLRNQILPNLRRLLSDLAPRAIEYRPRGGRRGSVRRVVVPAGGLLARPTPGKRPVASELKPIRKTKRKSA